LTHNYFLNCRECETIINIRVQIGFYDVPFNIHCPNCQTHIHGKLLIDQEEVGLKLEVQNASENHNEIDSTDNLYCAELSAEFLTNKMYFRDLGNNELPPYLNNMQFFSDDLKAIDATQSAMVFAQHFDNRWKKIKVLYELSWNNQVSLLYPKLEKEISGFDFIPIKKVNNDLDANIAMHQMMLTTTGITKALESKTLDKYIEISKHITRSKEIIEKVQDYICDISPKYNEIEKKAFKLIDSFSNIYEQLIPVVALRNTECLDNVDRKKYGIMTTNFEELTAFYAMSYEWILDNIDIVIALNNIVSRNDYSSCINNKSYDSILTIGSKYKKLDYIDDSESFSPPTSSLKNRIRNAIQHIDAEVDYMSQKVVFTDNYRGNTNEVTMYLIDFADLCIENFSIIIYILELIYNLKKIDYLSIGLIPSHMLINQYQAQRSYNKAGRNDLCPCGSGKKYKKCCLQNEKH